MYNPLGHPTDLWVRVPVGSGTYTVQDDGMSTVSSQIIPLSKATKNIPAHNGSTAVNELVFAAQQVPGLGIRTFFVKKNTMDTDSGVKETPGVSSDDGVITIGNEVGMWTQNGYHGSHKSYCI